MTEDRTKKLELVLRRRQKSLTVVFENVHDPHNVSAVIRSCDAVGVLEVHGIYYGRTEFPSLGEKSSGSARKWIGVNLYNSVDECYGVLRSRGFRIYTTHMSEKSLSLYDLDLSLPTALVFGNEHDGVSLEACNKADANFVVPQVGVVQSLNISVACAVSLYEAFRQRMQKGMYDASSLTDQEFRELRDSWVIK
ncbi:MAG: RNA methyltransferase [Ignavibacteria bacterium]|nr:RNA methyltransferase [Ignavibacteria bacterium]